MIEFLFFNMGIVKHVDFSEALGLPPILGRAM
jgi:hypothetical protein